MEKQDLSFEEVVEKYRDQKQLTRTEGTKGVHNLCELVRALGYKDPQYFGQFSPEASYGDLIYFLEDNPGAVEAILDFISEQDSSEWKENLESELVEDEEEDAE